MNKTDLKNLTYLDYPPITDDLELAKSHLDDYGVAIIKDVLSSESVNKIKERLEEQFYGEEKYKKQKFEEASNIFVTMSTSKEFEEFLTLPAYELI